MTAKVLAFALGCPCVGVNTLDVIASQVPAGAEHSGARTWAILDAQRRQLFAAAYQRERDSLTAIVPVQIINQTDWLTGLRSGDIVTGPGVAAVAKQLAANPDVRLVAEAYWQPDALAVARLGRRMLAAGQTTDAWRLAPQYYRLSAAEEKARIQPPAV